jgi:hypothetical protein
VFLHRFNSLVYNGHLVLLLRTTGSRTARSHLTPLYYTTDGDRIVVVAARGAWTATPTGTSISWPPPGGGRSRRDRAEFTARPVADPAERDRLFRRDADQHPVFDDFARRTRGRFPVITLEQGLKGRPGGRLRQPRPAGG